MKQTPRLILRRIYRDSQNLSTMRTRADEYVIYAETCAVDQEFLYKHRIEFRKIPRDILRYDATSY